MIPVFPYKYRLKMYGTPYGTLKAPQQHRSSDITHHTAISAAAGAKVQHTMHDKKHENEFHIIVDNGKLEEVCHRDGNTYVAMPLFSKVAYGVEFVEEIKGHGKVETVSQKWPVCPYTVAVRNKSGKGNFAHLYVDGQQVATKHVKAGDNVIFDGIPTENGIQELLFSLPRYATLGEKEIGGRALPADKTSDLGSVKIVWHDCVLTGQEFSPNHRSYRTTSFTQANKNDARATGQTTSGAGSGSGDETKKSFASTTRAGKVVGLNEARSCTVNTYKYVGEPWSSRLLYRTLEKLRDIGAVAKPGGTEEEEAERRASRRRRLKRKRERAEAERGGAPCPPPVPVEDLPPPVPTEEKDAGQ